MMFDLALFLILLSLVSSFKFDLESDNDSENSIESDPASVVRLYIQHLMSRQDCGRVKVAPSIGERIVGGENAQPGEMPWIAILGYHTNNEVDYSYVSCAGSLILDRFILTAAHCVDPSRPVEVKLGAHFVNNGTNFRTYPVKKIVKHAEYDQNTMTNDIALLVLGKRVKFTDWIQPICLPIKRYWRHNFAGVRALVAGWGYYTLGLENREPSPVLKKLNVRVWTLADCQDYDAKTTNQICAGGQTGRDSCNGDSGGPLVWQNSHNNRHYLIGLVSYGSMQCGIGKPGIYTRITKYLPWLIQHLVKEI